MKVLKYPNKKLLTKSTDVTDMREAKMIVHQLEETMAEQEWGNVVGFAAPQIGINKNVFIACDQVFINAKVTAAPKGGDLLNKEGCYSLEEGKFDYPVRRTRAVHVEWLDLEGQKHAKFFTGFKAMVIQHEYDHTQGRLCYDA